LARNDRLAVHALEADEQKVRRAREFLAARGLYGQAVVEPWAAPFLPYADNLVNVLVAENPGAVPEAEMRRVLAPLGTLWIKQGQTWRAQRKPWPKDFDEWTHWRHGADGNMVSHDAAVQTPSGVRWIAGPPQDDSGQKYYDHVMVSAAGRNFYLYDDALAARDAFNGRLLWRREAAAYTFKETGASKLATRTSKVRPVAAGDRVYAALEGKLVALEAASGRTALFLGDLEKPRELAMENASVFLSDANGLRAWQTNATPLWSSREPAGRFVAGDGKVFYLNGNDLVALDLRTGRELWRRQHPKTAAAIACSYYRGVLVLERASWSNEGAGNGIVVFSGERGDLLWEKDYTPGMSHFKEARAFFAGDLVWLEVLTFTHPRIIRFVGFDPRTGKERRSVGTRGRHCAAPVATDLYLITPEMEFTEIKTGQRSRARMAKNACRLPFVPANGLLYTFPVECECFPMLRGYMGLAQSPPARPLATPRLQPGPAFGRPARALLTASPAAEWPMYRRDIYRSGGAPEPLDLANFKKLWTTSVAQEAQGPVAADWANNPFVRGLVTPPVCASGLLLVAVPDRHRVVALDARTGKLRWTFVAGGRVDLPPTITGEVCVFGAHDGCVYCLSLADGQLVWRFRAAPFEARMAAYGQMESPWPVPGSVLVEGGVAFFAAGRHPEADGGVTVFGLRLSDGRVLWSQLLTDTGVSRWYGATLGGTDWKVGLDYEPVDLLAHDGARVAMSRWRFDPATGRASLAFNRTNYLAFAGLAVPRGIWGYGIRQAKQVVRKAPAVFNERAIFRGGPNTAALLLAGPTLIRADRRGQLTAGNIKLQLGSPPVPDGLLTAYARLYLAGLDGTVSCWGRTVGQ
jgi:outer membrane protein assembly factor BamB